jgi:D-glycerate 3-kinase
VSESRNPQSIATECPQIAAVIAARSASAGRPVIVGIAGAQGTGKSTLAGQLLELLRDAHGLRAVVVSLDDYYLPKAQRLELSRTVHPLLVTRGVPGTHDVVALQGALQRLRQAGADEAIELLQFSKAEDDRRAESRVVNGPFDVVLFEGWCVGASAESDAELAAPVNELELRDDPDGRFRSFVDAQLAAAYAALWIELDMLVFLAAPDLETVRSFRREQEEKLRLTAAAAASGVMSDQQLERFIQHFDRVTLHMLHEMPARADLVVRLDAQRRVVALESARSRAAQPTAHSKLVDPT